MPDTTKKPNKGEKVRSNPQGAKLEKKLITVHPKDLLNCKAQSWIRIIKLPLHIDSRRDA